MQGRKGYLLTFMVGLFVQQAFSSVAMADGPPFDLPVDCLNGQCNVVHYVDHDPGPGIRDYTCGTATYDGHRGTDFAIPDEKTMIIGVDIHAIAGGTVAALREGVEDIDAGRLYQNSLDGIECGNGILLDHDDGWQSQYCHLRRGSIAVKKGDRVKRGQLLGKIGISGQSTFPHLHLNLRRNNQLMDPFSGTPMGTPIATGNATNCTSDTATLWSENARAQLNYRQITLYGNGFSMARPNSGDIKRGYGRETELPRSSPGLYYWAYLIGANNGDVIGLSLKTPNGKGGHREFVIDLPDDNGPRAKWFFIKMDRPGAQWAEGIYRGEVTFIRPGQEPRLIGEKDILIR